VLQRRATKLEKQMAGLLDLESSHHQYIPERATNISVPGDWDSYFHITETMQVEGMCYSVFKRINGCMVYVYCEGKVKNLQWFVEFIKLVNDKMKDMQEFEICWKDGTTQSIWGTSISDAFHRNGYGSGAIRALDYWKPVTD
jgi:hypothetical protein